MIPFQNLRATHDNFLKDYFRDLQKVFQSDSPDFIGGSGSRLLAAFEADFAAYIGVKHALGLNSGTDALLLALDALGVGEGDEVILPAFGFIATADVIVRLKAKPVFVDVLPETFNLDPALVEAAITARTKAIIPVHLFGQAADMSSIMQISQKHHLAVIEDVAQATGADWEGKKLGSIGTFGCFSFYPTKNLGGAGDGGLITTNDDALAAKIRLFRDHGRGPGGFETIGYNSRLDSIQALYLHHKLEELDDSLLDRIDNARLYNSLLKDTEVVTPAVPDGEHMQHTFNLYTIRVRDRDRLQRFLKEKEIATAIYYDKAMPFTPALSFLGHREGEFPQSEEAARSVLSLPVWPGLSRQQIKSVAEAVQQFLNNNLALGARR